MSEIQPALQDTEPLNVLDAALLRGIAAGARVSGDDAQAIPPAYTEFIGNLILAYLDEEQAA